MRKTALVLVTALFLIGCGDGGSGSGSTNSGGKGKPECEVQQTAIVMVANTSSNPYNFYINGMYFTQIVGKSNKTLTIKAGYNNLYAKQVSGYLLYPTECRSEVNAIACNNYSWQIP